MIRLALVIGALGLPLAASAAQSDQGPPRWAANIARKQFVIMNGIPAPYAAMRDPMANSAAKLRHGRTVFEQHCSSCHGWSGHGSGPEAFALVPAPADLAWLAGTPKRRSDPYVYWSIAEGGQRFDSDMPAFKGSLPKNDIWAVTSYIRAGLPRRSP